MIGKGTPMLPISTSLSTRSGCWVAIRSAIAPPKLLPTRLRLLDAERVHQPDGLVGPRLQAVLDVLRPVRVAEADHVRGDDAEFLGQRRDHQAPVRVRRDARARAVDQQHGVVAGTVLEVVRLDSVGDRVAPISGFAVAVMLLSVSDCVVLQ